MSKPEILICGDLVWAQKDAQELFAGLATLILMSSPDRPAFVSSLKSCTNLVGIYRHNSSAERIGIFDKELITELPSTVKWIAHNGAGYDQIDVIACWERGIKVSNTPTAVNTGTATTALYLLISAARQFSVAERGARSGKWKSLNSAAKQHDPSALTLGILGMGGIGETFARMCVGAFGMKVKYHSRRPHPEADRQDFEYVRDLYDFMGSCDVVSIHIPLREDTVGFVGAKELRAMKKGSILINTARGAVVDEEALISCLQDGHLGAAGLDVYPSEPTINPRFFALPNVTLLPHMGTETVESQHGMEMRALGNLKDFLQRGSGGDLVPECAGM